MTRESTARQVIESQTSEELKIPRFGGGEPPSPPFVAQPIISNARLALLMFLGAEAMFFAGLVGAFLVFRIGSPSWPPPFQPRLPVVVTGVNTLILLLSAATMRWALKAIRAGEFSRLIRYVLITALLGLLFLAIQGYEWIRLVHFGLTVSSGVYGATFYTLIGCHALHVFGAVIWLLVVLGFALRGGFTASRHTSVVLCGMYWTFVVALWPILYGLVYLY
jgi:cytochrome c oxidase subunit 3